MENENDNVVEESMYITFHGAAADLVEPQIQACREQLRANGGSSRFTKRKNLIGNYEVNLQLKGPRKAVVKILLTARSIVHSSWDQVYDAFREAEGLIQKTKHLTEEELDALPDWDEDTVNMVKAMRPHFE